MAKFCSECGKSVKPEWQLCPYCSNILTKETSSDSIQPSITQNKKKIGSESYFWKLNLIGGIITILSLVLPYQYYHKLFLSLPDPDLYGCWWLWGLSVSFYESEGFHFSFSFGDGFDILIAAIIAVLAIMLLAEALAEKKGEATIKNLNTMLIILGVVVIGVSIVEFINTIPTQYPTLITEIVPVGSIPAFFAGGISIFSGILRVVKK